MITLSVHEAERRATNTDRIAAFFTSRPGIWIPATVLEDVGGRHAWRTRISECRTILGMRIDNRQRSDGSVRISEYRYVPEGQQELSL